VIRTLLIVALGTTFIAAGCGDDDDGNGAQTPPGATATTGAAETPTQAGSLPGNLTTIRVVDNSYTPTGLQVPVGTRVTWTWEGVVPHTVSGTFNGETVESGVQELGGEFEFEFTSAGIFEYFCMVHGTEMSGTVTVQ
jgi:plastocyanin